MERRSLTSSLYLAMSTSGNRAPSSQYRTLEISRVGDPPPLPCQSSMICGSLRFVEARCVCVRLCELGWTSRVKEVVTCSSCG